MFAKLRKLNDRIDRHNHATAEEMGRLIEKAFLRSPRLFLSLLSVIALFTLLLALASADCATGSDCTFANGDLANWLFPKIKFLEWAFWTVVPG